MSNFLNFLNTADHDTLTKISGISNSLAESIIASRPFDSADDILLIHGMGKALLTKMQSFAEAQENDSESRSVIQVEEEAQPAAVEKSQPAQKKAKDGESFPSRMGRAFVNFLRALLKLILIVVLIGSIGALLYYGLPYIQKTFIAPAEQNAVQINRVDSEISVLQTQLAKTNTRVDALEISVQAQTLSIQKLEEMQATIETKIQTNNDMVLLGLKHEVMLTRALDMLARARLYLAQSNFGFAKTDVQSARDLLAELQTETNDEVLLQVISRLDLALGNLPDFPVVASGDLEIAWQILMTGEQANLATHTPTPTFIQTVTPRVFETFTPTPQTTPTTGTSVSP